MEQHEISGDLPGNLMVRQHMQKLRSVIENLPNEGGEASLITILKISGKPAPRVPTEVVVVSFDLIVEGAPMSLTPASGTFDKSYLAGE